MNEEWKRKARAYIKSYVATETLEQQGYIEDDDRNVIFSNILTSIIADFRNELEEWEK